MKIKTFLALIMLFALNTELPAEEGRSCLETAMTQTEMNQCAGVGYEEADAELNRVYRKIREIYKDDPKFLEELKISQLAWIKLRDADLDLEYSYSDKPSQYGSIIIMCASGHKAYLALRRVEFLKRWLKGVEEGDACGSSQKYQRDLKEVLGNKYIN